MSSASPAQPVANSADPHQVHPILRHLNQKIKPVELQKEYRLGLLGAALVMVLLLLTYLFVVAFVSWYLVHTLLSIPLSFGIIKTAVKLTIILALGSVLLALIKPLLARRESQFSHFTLAKEQEPLLFAYVDRICQVVGSPHPTEIVVDTQVNASASFVKGPFDKDLRLTIGLPLVHSLDTRSLTGVLAHEFGHFSQASGMRMSYFIRSLDAWFLEAANSRDVWDQKLYEWSETWVPPFSWSIMFVRGAVWLARKMLVGLTMTGHFFVARLLREMEFDADRYEARMVGIKAFATTSRKLRILGMCQSKTFDDLDHYRRMNQLPDNLTAMMVDNERQVDQEKFAEVEKMLLASDTHWSDSHPCDRERIENAARENTDGVFRLEQPSPTLFSDFKSLCQILTFDLYKEAFKKDFDPSKVKDTDELIAARNVHRVEGKAALRFVMEQFCGYDTVFFPRPALGRNIDSNTYRKTTQQHRDRLLYEVRGYAKLRQQEDKTWGSLAQSTCAKRLIEAGFDLSQTDMFESDSLQEAHIRIMEFTRDDNRLQDQLRPFRQRMGMRLMDALEFLRAPKMIAKIDESPEVLDEVKQIFDVWNKVVELRDTFEAFFFETRVSTLLVRVVGEDIDLQTGKAIKAAMWRLTDNMTHIQQSTAHLMYPFDHGLGKISVAHYLVADLPNEQDVVGTIDKAIDMDKNLEFMLKRCVGRLGALAEKVENAFGFEALETPDEIEPWAR